MTLRLLAGLVLVALGVLFTLQNLHLVDADRYIRLWPGLLVLVGLAKMMSARSLPERTGALVWLLAGSLLLLDQLDVVDFDLWDLWPLLLVFLGIHFVARATWRAAPDGTTAQGSNTTSAFALLSGVGRKLDTRDFRGGEATAIMGGCEIDLRQAAMPAGREAVIDVFAFWGGIEIMVPGDWTVVNETFALMGGVEDSREQSAGDPAKRLLVKGTVIMGGVEIKN
jgi:predicted membrane protein